MALTNDIITANEALKDLDEAQIGAIVELSANDEAAVIGKKTGEIHSRYDTDILEATGMEKNQGEKSYDYLKRAAGQLKQQLEGLPGLQTEIETQKQTIADLNKKIEDGNTDEAIKQQLADARKGLQDIQTLYEAEKNGRIEDKKGYDNQLRDYRVNSVFGQVYAGLKFKPEYDENIQRVLTKNAKEAILSEYTPDWIKADDKEVLVFRDKDNNIVRNANNAMKPYTVEELVKGNAILKNVLDLGRKATGGGTESNGGGGSDLLVDLSGAATQVEADNIIDRMLMEQGIAKGTAAFAEQKTKIRNENKVSELPVR